MEIIKKQTNEKISHLEKELIDAENRLVAKEKENRELQSMVEQSTKENENLSKRIEELLMS